jgi:hypothetical protein
MAHDFSDMDKLILLALDRLGLEAGVTQDDDIHFLCKLDIDCVQVWRCFTCSVAGILSKYKGTGE